MIVFFRSNGIEYDEAINKFYNSKVFEKLQDKETGLYMGSSEYVYDLFKDEMNLDVLFKQKYKMII